MATIRKRGTAWQAIVRRKGYSQRTKQFEKKADAIKWARAVETLADNGDLPKSLILERFTLKDLIDRYEKEISPKKKSALSDCYTLKIFKRFEFIDKNLIDLTSRDFVYFRDERLKEVKAPTVRRNLAIIRHVLEVARKECNIPIDNPLALVSNPKASEARDRRLEGDDLKNILEACEGCLNKLMKPLILFAIETSMRRSEIVSATWSNIDYDKCVLFLPDTKNGKSRYVPLSSKALDIIKSLPRTDDRLFPLSGNAVRLSWERIKVRAKITDLRFHDLRHEGISRLFEKGLSVPEAALVSGHSDMKMLFRYTHVRPENVAAKLG